jgi:DivIVA domain-containing protein
MDLTPSQISGASFRTVRKGYDPDEVDDFLGRAAQALEVAQQQATAMEARARAAVTRLQEVTAAAAAAAPPADGTAADAVVVETVAGTTVEHELDHQPHLSANEAETISRTLLLAQHTADTTVADAEAEADRIRLEAQSEAESTIDSTREMSARLLEEARSAARKASEAERQAAENEVQSLKARREFLIGDVDQLEQFLVEQRDRLRGAARQIEALVERVPAGLGPVPAPALSASDDEPGDETAELFLPPEAKGPFATVDELAEALEQGDTQPIPVPELFDEEDEDDQDLSDSADDLPVRHEKPPSD